MARLTIPDQQTFATFTATAQTVFPISFALLSGKADLRVSIDGVELNQSDFTFSGPLLDGGGYSGGTVTLNTAATGSVRIWRYVRPARATNFAPSGTVPVGSVDQAINRLTATQQDLRYSLDEGLEFEVGNTPITARGLTRPNRAWVGEGLVDISYEVRRARDQSGYNGDDSVAFNAAVAAAGRGVQMNPEVGYLNCKTSLRLPVSNTKLVFQGGGQAVPIFRDAALAGASTMIVGTVAGAGAGSSVVEGAWFVHAGRLGWYGDHAEGTPLPDLLTGEESHIEVHGAQSARIRVGGYGARHLVSVFGGNDCVVNVASYGGMYDPDFVALQEAVSVVRLTRSAVHGHGTCHTVDNPLIVGGNVSGRRPVVIGAQTVMVTRRLGPYFGVLIESCENPKIRGGFSGGMAHSNVGITPVIGGFIANIAMEGHDADESNESAVYAWRQDAAAPCPHTLMISKCTFNGQLIGRRALEILGDNGLYSIRNLQMEGNTFRAHLSGVGLLTGVDGGSIRNERLAGYNCAAANATGGDPTTAGHFLGGITRNLKMRDILYGGGINQDGETNTPDTYGVTPNGTQWGRIDGTPAEANNTYSRLRAINFGQAGGDINLGGTLDNAA